MTKIDTKFKQVKSNKIIFPIIIGLGVTAYMLWKSFKEPGTTEAFSLIEFTYTSVFWFFIAFLLMLSRDVGYIIRLRVLSDKKFTWLQSFRIIMLWEFTSAVTPSAIGGTSLAVIYVNKEGLSIGHSSAVVMATSFLDELYFILMFPILVLWVGSENLFAMGGEVAYAHEFMVVALTGYAIKLAYLIIISYGLFINPKGLKWLLLKIFKLPFLKKWKEGAEKAGDDIVKSSVELKKRSFRFWTEAFLSTFFSWTSRYWVVNALFLAFFSVGDHFLLFARQLVMWIMMLISPTPGGSGFSEFVFSNYLGDFLPFAGMAVVMAVLWRLATYYPYLFIGVIILPKWIKNKFLNGKSTVKKQPNAQ